ncbi:hypothetical protein D3C85_664990 [compost metagenome]
MHTVARCRDGAGCRIKRRSTTQIGRHAGTQGAQARRCGRSNTSQLAHVDRIGRRATGSKIGNLAFGARRSQRHFAARVLRRRQSDSRVAGFSTNCRHRALTQRHVRTRQTRRDRCALAQHSGVGNAVVACLITNDSRRRARGRGAEAACRRIRAGRNRLRGRHAVIGHERPGVAAAQTADRRVQSTDRTADV